MKSGDSEESNKASVIPLVVGSSEINTFGDIACSVAIASCTLIRDGGKNILVDTLGPWSRDELVAHLLAYNLTPDDIDFVIGTHGHPDHIGNLNLFTSTKTRHIVGFSIYQGDNYNITHDWNAGLPYQITPNVTIYPTPGHTLSCITAVVENVTDLGSVAVAGDLFENEEDLTNESVWLSVGSEDPVKQRTNRSLILSKVNYIIPGHGAMFKVPSK